MGLELVKAHAQANGVHVHQMKYVALHPSVDVGYTVNVTASSNAKFVLNTTAASQPEAQATCERDGGHLAAFRTWQEQYQVETFLVDNVSLKL